MRPLERDIQEVMALAKGRFVCPEANCTHHLAGDGDLEIARAALIRFGRNTGEYERSKHAFLLAMELKKLRRPEVVAELERRGAEHAASLTLGLFRVRSA